MSNIQDRCKGYSFQQANPSPMTIKIRRRSLSSPDLQTPEQHLNISSKYGIFLSQIRSKKELSLELFSDSYRYSERTAVTSRNCSKSEHLISHNSSQKFNINSLFTPNSGLPSCRISLDQQIQQNESDEFEKRNLLNIKEEPEGSETNSITSFIKFNKHETRTISANPQIQDKVNALRSIFFNQTLSLERSQQYFEESKILKDYGGLNLSQNSNGQLYFFETQQKYEKLKQHILSTSEHLLRRKTICQKSPIFLSDEERTLRDQNSFANYFSTNKLSWDSNNQLSRDSIKDLANNKNQPTNSFNKETTEKSDKLSVSNYDNMVYHIFAKPQSSLKESLSKFDSSSLVTQQILYKKVYGFLDRYKKKIVSLYPDRLCYQESKSSPISTISFRHFDISLSKENQSKIFTLSIESLQKKFSFRCSDEKQRQFWVSAIADIIILNQSRKKFILKPMYTSIYSKKQVCSFDEALAALNTGDLIIYQLTTNQKTNNFHLAVIIKTKFLLQVCYYSHEEGILTYPLESFLMLFQFANVSYRTLIVKHQLYTSEQLVEDCITFINKNNMLNKYKDSNSFCHSLLCEIGILKSNSTSNIAKKKETMRTAKLNIFTTNEYQFSEEVYLLLPKHLQSIINNTNHWQLHSLVSDQVMKNNQMQLKIIENYSECSSSQISKQCLLRHQSLIPISYRNSSLPLTHQQGIWSLPHQIPSSFADFWELNQEQSSSFHLFFEQNSQIKGISHEISDQKNNPLHPSYGDTASQAQYLSCQAPRSSCSIQISNSYKSENLNQTTSQLFQSPTQPSFHPQYNYIQLGKDYQLDHKQIHSVDS